MTTYRAISDTEVAVDAPLTQQLMQALKDNTEAMFEGDATAPSISSQAFGCVAGNVLFFSDSINTGTVAEQQGVDKLSSTYTFTRTGTVKIYYRVAISLNETLSYSHETDEDEWGNTSIARMTYVGRVYINGSLVASTESVNRTDGINVYRSINLATQSVSAGDTIQFKLDRTDSNNSSQFRAAFISNFGFGLSSDQSKIVSIQDPVLSAF